MNIFYILQMTDECVGTFNSEKSERVCDLDASSTLVLFLSTHLVRPLPPILLTPASPQALGLCIDAATLYSAVTLGYKLAHAEIIKFALDEKERLQQERTALLGELGASLSPELALQVERIIDRRSSFMPDNIMTPRSNPVDGKETDTPHTAQEVHSTGPLSLEPSESSVSATCKCGALRAGACTNRRRCADGCFGRACCSAGAVRCGMLWHLAGPPPLPPHSRRACTRAGISPGSSARPSRQGLG